MEEAWAQPEPPVTPPTLKKKSRRRRFQSGRKAKKGNESCKNGKYLLVIKNGWNVGQFTSSMIVLWLSTQAICTSRWSVASGISSAKSGRHGGFNQRHTGIQFREWSMGLLRSLGQCIYLLYISLYAYIYIYIYIHIYIYAYIYIHIYIYIYIYIYTYRYIYIYSIHTYVYISIYISIYILLYIYIYIQPARSLCDTMVGDDVPHLDWVNQDGLLTTLIYQPGPCLHRWPSQSQRSYRQIHHLGGFPSYKPL